MSEHCPGIPEECAHARRVINDALDGVVAAHHLVALRAEIGHCTPCVNTFEIELHFRAVMSERCHEAAPESLKLRITAALRGVDLNELDVTDL